MAHEIETKVLDIDLKKIISKLRKLGAKKIKKDILMVKWYRLKGVKEGEDPWFLRIRSYSGKNHEVTWKAKSNISGIVRKHKEINFGIDDHQNLSDLFEEIGLEEYAYQEKIRTSFTHKKWRFDIDQYPQMPLSLR
jgi:predicted adenylyl cyclase CyaB